MFGELKLIIAVTKPKIVVAQVRTWGPKKVRNTREYGWDLETLDIALAKIKETYKAKTARILLGDKLSYVLRLKIPSEYSGSEERKYIKEKIIEKIPEDLGTEDWDFKELRFDYSKTAKKAREKEVIVFAPVKGFFEKLSMAVEKLNISIEAIEPEAMAKTRHSNPMIGLALKTDIKGKDEEVLNIEPLLGLEKKEPGESEEFLETDLDKKEKEKGARQISKPGQNKILIAIIIVLLLGLISLGALYIYRTRAPEKKEVVTTPTSTVTPEPTPKKAEEVEEVDIYEYSIEILNGSGIAGQAAEVEQALFTEGFEDLGVSNADSFDYKNMLVEMKAYVPEEVYGEIVSIFEEDYLVLKSEEVLGDDSEFDVRITVGAITE